MTGRGRDFAQDGKGKTFIGIGLNERLEPRLGTQLDDAWIILYSELELLTQKCRREIRAERLKISKF